MRARSILIGIVVAALFSCKKSDTVEPQKPFLSFKINATEYKLDAKTFNVLNPSGSIMISSAIQWGTHEGVATDFPYWFNIGKSNTGTTCAVLLPKEFRPLGIFYPADMCNIGIDSTDGFGNPLPMEKIFYSQSGTLTYSKSNCANKSYYDIYCLCMQNADMCDVNGSFNLSFRNGLNQTLTLTDGAFFMNGVAQ